MNESEKRARWSRFAAVTRIEWQDHARRSLCPAGMLKTLQATCRRKVATRDAVISRRAPATVSCYTAEGWPLGVPRCRKRRTMFKLACVGHIQLLPVRCL